MLAGPAGKGKSAAHDRYRLPRPPHRPDLAARQRRAGAATTGQPLLLTDLPGIGPDEIDRGERSLWRYRAALPPLAGDPISMGEGCTPLVAARHRRAPPRC